MILCVVAHCISSSGMVHRITKVLQALNEKEASHKKREFPDASGNEYLVNEALTYMSDLNPAHLLLTGLGNAKKMVPAKQTAPINKNSATISVSIQYSCAEYHLTDAPARH